MHTLGYLALSWVLQAILVMISVAAVAPKSPENNFSRALLVSLLATVLVRPFAGFLGIILIIPAILALILWTAIYALAYGIGPMRAIGAGIVQAALGFAIDVLVLHGRVA